MKKGFTLIELLISITIFSILAVLATQSIALTIRGVRKAERTALVREELNYAFGIMERHLRNSATISSSCPSTDPYSISYIDSVGVAGDFTCVDMGGTDPYIASASARLTSTNVEITTCSFSCSPKTSTTPTKVTFELVGQIKDALPTEDTYVTVYDTIYLRDY